jgi:hypothetical protein
MLSRAGRGKVDLKEHVKRPLKVLSFNPKILWSSTLVGPSLPTVAV